MTMFPFTIKVTNQSVERLCRITSQNRQQNFDVDVQMLLHQCEIHQLHALSHSTRRHLRFEILNEAQEHAYQAFLPFLRSVAEPEIFLPTDLLNRYPHRQYCLLMSPNRSRELFDVYNINGRHSQRLVTYIDYELIVEARPQLLDTEAYLVAPSKYTLFIRQVNEANTIDVYRSDFIDLAVSTPPPLDLHAQDVIDTIQHSFETEFDESPRWRQLLMFPISQEIESSAKLSKCPKCDGQIQRIGEDSYFCLDCDWDNLQPLR